MGQNGNTERTENTGSKNKDISAHTQSSQSSQSSQTSQVSERMIRQRGDYQTLLSYQKSVVIYQITYRFCEKYLEKGDLTIDQMIQAARSGKQNIIEGNRAAPTSTEMEIKLTNVARASLEELLEDYRDFLRARDLAVWDKQSSEARYVRKLGMTTPLTFDLFREFVETRSAEVVANIAICLIHQATYLLDHQLDTLEKVFIQNGGLRERMTRVRLQARDSAIIEPGNTGNTESTGS